MPRTVRNAQLAYSMKCSRQPATGQSVRNEKPEETTDRQLRCTAKPLLGCAVVVADDGPMRCRAATKHTSSTCARLLVAAASPMCAPFFEAVPRAFGTRASLPRPHDVLLFGIAEPSKAPLRCGIDRLASVARRR
jgi:hypothetical protein